VGPRFDPSGDSVVLRDDLRASATAAATIGTSRYQAAKIPSTITVAKASAATERMRPVKIRNADESAKR
jgi:hypothetical protein